MELTRPSVLKSLPAAPPKMLPGHLCLSLGSLCASRVLCVFFFGDRRCCVQVCHLSRAQASRRHNAFSRVHVLSTAPAQAACGVWLWAGLCAARGRGRGARGGATDRGGISAYGTRVQFGAGKRQGYRCTNLQNYTVRTGLSRKSGTQHARRCAARSRRRTQLGTRTRPHGRATCIARSERHSPGLQLTCATCSRKLSCKSSSTRVTSPQSRMHSRPSLVRSRLPGCGSQCSSPVERSIERYVLRATPHSFETSSACERSSRSPSTHRVTSSAGHSCLWRETRPNA